MLQNVTVRDKVVINKDGVTLDGGNHKITVVAENPNPLVNSVVEVSGNNVTIKNIELVGTNGNTKHGVQFYDVTDGKMSNVTVTDTAWTGVLVNASTVTIENSRLNPTGADVYANIEYCIGSSTELDTIPEIHLNNVTGTDDVMVWADYDTVTRVDALDNTVDGNEAAGNKILSSITTANNDAITVSIDVNNNVDNPVNTTKPSTKPVEPSNPGSSSSSGSGSTTYSPTLDVSDGGTIKVSPRTPEAGDKVTITPDPDNGYEVGEVTVTDRSGDAVRVTANRDGTYTFTQPRGRVTIEVTFVRAGESVFFDDVPASFWAYDEIAWAYDNGYVNGTSAATFSPNSSITRQQVWMILARLSGADPASMAAAREWAMVNDISDGTNPGNAVTRQQLVALLYRYAQLMGYDNGAREALSSFPDAGTVSGYAQEPMQWSVANGIVAGTSAGTLNPTGTATRAQFAVILYRFWDQVG